MCFQCLEGKFGPVWVHKCVFPHVSQAPRGADKLPLMTLHQRAGLKIRFRGSIISFQRQSQTVSGVNRPVRFRDFSLCAVRRDHGMVHFGSGGVLGPRRAPGQVAWAV